VFGGLHFGAGPAQPAASGALYAGEPIGAWQTVQGQSGITTAAVKYRQMGWGTEVDSRVTGIPVGTNCQLYVIDSMGHRLLVGDWVTDNDEGIVWYPGSVAVSAHEVMGFQLTVAKGQTIDIPA
jgi:hypothetical protein